MGTAALADGHLARFDVIQVAALVGGEFRIVAHLSNNLLLQGLQRGLVFLWSNCGVEIKHRHGNAMRAENTSELGVFAKIQLPSRADAGKGTQ